MAVLWPRPFLFAVSLSLCSCLSRPLTEEDRAFVLNVRDLNAMGEDYPVLVGEETWEKTRWFDGSIDLEYEYSPPERVGLYISSNLSFERSRRDATLTYKAQRFGFTAAYDYPMIKRQDLFSWGEESEFYILQNEDSDPIGNFFIGRKGKTVYMTAVVGTYFDDSEIFGEFASAKLSKSAARQ